MVEFKADSLFTLWASLRSLKAAASGNRREINAVGDYKCKQGMVDRVAGHALFDVMCAVLRLLSCRSFFSF